MLEILDKEDVKYCLGPMATAVGGNWEHVMSAIRSCHDAMRQTHARVITTITIDDREGAGHHLDEIVPFIEKRLGHKAKQGQRRQPVGDLD
jgi:uncharacterized protein YqgV (UPF0045/DUF77 family)